MKFSAWTAVSVFLVLAAAAVADVVNGDFSNVVTRVEDGTHVPVGWFAPMPNTVNAIQDVVDYDGQANALYLYAKNTYQVVEGQWVCQDAPAFLFIGQPDMGDTLTAPAGTTALAFKAAVQYVADDVVDQALSNQVVVELVWTGGAEGSNVLAPAVTDWHGYEIGLAQDARENVTACQFALTIYANNWLNDGTVPDEGTTRTVEIKAYLDDVRFVPEPATMVLLALGSAVMFLRRRRQAA